MQAITNLCSRVVLLNKGTVALDSNPLEVVRNYLMFEASKEGALEWNDQSAPGNSMIKLSSIKLMDQDNNIRSHFFSRGKIKVQFDFTIHELDSELVIGFDISNENGVIILRTYQNDGPSDSWPTLKTGKNSILCELPEGFFNAGTYYISPKISLHCKNWIINSDPLLSFDVEVNHGLSPFWNRITKANRPGSVAIILPWKVKDIAYQTHS
jgi:lipopolysaccharide transport system ATP-binding protein